MPQVVIPFIQTASNRFPPAMKNGLHCSEGHFMLRNSPVCKPD